MNFSQFVNQNVTILGRRLYSPSLKDVAWLEDVQVIFLIFHTFVCKFCRLDKRLDAVRRKKCSDRKFKKISPAQLHPSKLGEYNLLPIVF